MTNQTASDVTFVLRVWIEPGDHQPRARLLRTDHDSERMALGTAAIVALVDDAVADFATRAGRRDATATPPRWLD